MLELTGLRARLRASTVWLAAARLQTLLGKANFNPNQPRVPPGRREGGQWTRDGSGKPSAPIPDIEFEEDGRPRIPEEKPESPRYRYLLSRAVANWLSQLVLDSPPVEILRAGHWIYQNAPAIWSYLDRPKPLGELQRRARQTPTPRGYEVHHIVEQSDARRFGFRGALIEGDTNLVLVPTYRHRDITALFMTRNDDYDALSPREYLRDKSWEERMRVGLRALIENGVLEL